MPGIYKNPKIGNRILMFGIVMFIIFIASVFAMAFGRESYPQGSIVLGAAWVVGVPIYFFFEHVVLFRKYGDPDQYDQFERVQDLAAKIWAGAVIVLAAFYTQTFPK